MTTPAPMENAVRPFASVPIHPPATSLPAPVPPGVVECKLGGSGGTTTSFSFEGQTGKVTSGDSLKESSRSSTNVRVENPDDPSQFVEFCRADRITLKPKMPDPPRQSSFDPEGGAHGDSVDRTATTYEFQYPTERTCVSREPPKGGNC